MAAAGGRQSPVLRTTSPGSVGFPKDGRVGSDVAGLLTDALQLGFSSGCSSSAATGGEYEPDHDQREPELT